MSLQGPFSISTAIDGSAMSYNINYTNSTSGESCGSAAIPTKSSLCTNDLCTHEFNISTSLCSPSTALSVVVFASNILGDGVVSKELTFGRFKKLHFWSKVRAIINLQMRSTILSMSALMLQPSTSCVHSQTSKTSVKRLVTSHCTENARKSK